MQRKSPLSASATNSAKILHVGTAVQVDAVQSTEREEGDKTIEDTGDAVGVAVSGTSRAPQAQKVGPEACNCVQDSGGMFPARPAALAVAQVCPADPGSSKEGLPITWPSGQMGQEGKLPPVGPAPIVGRLEGMELILGLYVGTIEGTSEG